MDEHWDVVLALCTLVLGEQETELLRRRSKVPTAAAV
jgi:hypothetical protein